MSSEIDPIGFSKELQATFRRYLYTSNLICDSEPALQDSFWENLSAPLRILNGPFVHCIPAYRPAESLADMIAGAHAGVKLSQKFLQLPNDEFDPSRPLHSHQVEAIEKAGEGRNLIVATGTGSGKTECFMLPILQSIFEDPKPGLRAIIVYPMNALANDQLDRMRRMLVNAPEVTFGRYTGDTPGACANDEEKKRAGAITNERYTREEMREAPPHILLTNFAMLEYLLLRPRDADLFRDHHLRYLVLDEAHTYGGAQGIEIALLMRRLKEYLGLAPDRLQFLLTSATIGGPESTDEVIRFAHDLTGQTFELGDVLRGETVTSFDKQLSPMPSLQTLREIVPDGDAFEKWTTAVDDVVKLHSLLEIAGLQPGPLGARVAHRLLYDVFSRSKILADLHALCQAHALSFADICQALGLPDDEASHRGVSWLIALGAHARYGPESAPLLPTRSHFFCRGLAGATVCLNEACGGKSRDADRRWSAFFLEDRKQCGHCESSVLPLCTCVHCGMPVARVRVRDGKWSAGADDLFNQSQPVLLTWLGDLDEDEDEQTNADDGPVPSDNSTALLCLTCHAFSEDAQTITCCTTPSLRRLQRLHPSDDQGNLARCPRCAGGSGSFPTVLRTFVTGDDAPAAVLTETLMRHLPRNEAMLNGNRLPAHGRNLLVFSDSRQRAAFFAPYLSQTMAETAFLGPIEQALRKAEAREDRATTMEEIAAQYIRDLNPATMPVAVIRSRDEDGLEHYKLVATAALSNPQRSAAKKEAQVSLFRHVCASTKQRGTLTGLGIAALTFDVSEWRWDQVRITVPEIFTKGERFARELIEALLTVFTQKGAVDFPDPLQTRDVLRYGKHTPKACTFSLTQSASVDGRSVSRWNPYLAPANSRNRAIKSSRQLGILARGLGLARFEDEQLLSKTLNVLWDQFKEELLVVSPWPGEYRITNDRVLLTTRAAFAACEVCGRLTTAHELGFCASPQCLGQPRLLDPNAEQRRSERNHYRRRYMLSPMPLAVKEHTAQLTNEAAKDYQEKFIRGEINVLSSSTTFEMGVDVGGLKAVLLRNMPPKSSNYVQRAGRAGRRKDGVSVAVTYARNAPHDQYLYQSPKMIIEGRMPVPFINVLNTVLAQRHANSLLLGYFLRAMAEGGMDAASLDKATVEDFFLSDASETLSLQFCKWLREPGVRIGLLARLTAILPTGIALMHEQAIDEAEAALVQRNDSVFKERVEAPLQRFQEQLDDVRAQANDMARPLAARAALGRSAISLDC